MENRKILIALFVLLWRMGSLDASEISCPEGGRIVDYTSPVYKTRTVFCQINHDGKLVHHGPQIVYGEDGKVTERNYYQYGVKSEAPALKGGDNYKNLENAFVSIISTFLVHSKDRLSRGSFNVGKCDRDKDSTAKWIFFFLGNGTPRKLNFKLGEKCDVEGNFSVTLGKLSDVKLKTRNLGEIERLFFKMMITFDGPAAKISIDVPEGYFYTKTDTIKISGNYAVIINPMKKGLIEKDLGGKLEIVSINAKQIKKTIDIFVQH